MGGIDANGYNGTQTQQSETVVQWYQSYYGPGINCGATIYQGLVISCGTGWNSSYYGINELVATSYSNSEVNYRDEFSGQQIWAKEPQGIVTQ